MSTQYELRAEELVLKKTYIDMIDESTDIVPFETTGIEKSYLTPSLEETFSPSLDESYLVFKEDSQIGVIYVVSSYGKYANLQIAYAILFETDSCVGVKVIENEETPTYFDAIDDTFYNQFDEIDLNSNMVIDAVAGSTYSSKGFEIGLLFAREQYAFDFDFSVPSNSVLLNSLTYNFDPLTFAEKPYIANVTYGVNNTNIELYLSRSFDYAGLVTGVIEPIAEVKAEIKLLASSNQSISNRAYFVSYDELSRTLIMNTIGYNPSSPIQATIGINGTFDGIESFVISSHESYSESSGYSGLPVPQVENDLLNEYVTNGTLIIDGVAGATSSSNAMQRLITLLNLFVDSLNGGN